MMYLEYQGIKIRLPTGKIKVHLTMWLIITSYYVIIKLGVGNGRIYSTDLCSESL